MSKVNWKDNDYISDVCANSYSLSDACKKLNILPQSNMRTLKKYIALYEINIDHFDPYKFHGGTIIPKIPLVDILKENSTYHRWHLKNRLIEEGIIANQCASCMLLPVWKDKELKLHLDHINGCNTDNRLSNLQLLCPNCHSQTSTYGGKNKTSFKCK